MVDLRPKANEQFREFKPSGTVNKSQKKREKAKAKKLKEKEMKAIEEQKAREKTMEAAKKKRLNLHQDSEIIRRTRLSLPMAKS